MKLGREPPDDWPWGNNWIDLQAFPQEWETVRDILELSQEFARDFIHGTPGFKPFPVFAGTELGLITECGMYSEVRQIDIDRFGVALDAFTPLQLLDTFSRLLSNPDVLPDIGRAPAAYEARSLMRFYYPGPGAEALSPGNKRPAPLGDDQRTACITILTSRALQFMYLHEFSHIGGGHIQYKRSLLDLLPLERAGALELLADRDAVMLAMHFESDFQSDLEPSIRTAYPGLASKTIRLWGFAVGIWFHLVEAFFESTIEREPLRYPPARIRSVLVNGSLAGVAEEPFFMPSRVILQQLETGFQEAHDAWELMGWEEHELPAISGVRQALREAEVALAETRAFRAWRK